MNFTLTIIIAVDSCMEIIARILKSIDSRSIIDIMLMRQGILNAGIILI